MKIHLQQIPPEGKHFEGEVPCPLPDVANEVRCVGPMRYSVDVGVGADAMWANGRISQDVELECVSCLTKFVHRIDVPDFAAHIELNGPELVDLTPEAREELLLNLPAHPHCDQHGGRVCQPATLPEREDAQAEEEKKREAAWDALNKLKLEK